MDSDNSDFSLIQFSETESLLTTSQYAKVIFHNVAEKYCSDKDLNCQYSSQTEDFCANLGDRIVLFKLGWQSITDYELFEWAPLLQANNKSLVIFKAEYLPRDSNEFYQFCYVNAENAICGASIPFQFAPSSINSTSLNIQNDLCEADGLQTKYFQPTSCSISNNQQVISLQPKQEYDCPPDTSNKPSCTECIKLKIENKLLEHAILHFNSSLQNYDSKINDMKKEIECLRTMLNVTQNDVSDFKVRLKLAGEEFKKLFIEKTRTEKKYEKLVKKCQAKKSSESVNVEFDFLDELEPFPAFPFSLTQL